MSPISLLYERDMNEYKKKLKHIYKPTNYKFFSRAGTKRGSSLMTQLRVGRSKLNDHSFSIGLAETAACRCQAPHESTRHILLQCPLYYSERQILLGRVEQLISRFNTFGMYKKVDILLFGIYPDNPDYYYININLQATFQKFLLSTKRFDNQ